MAIYSNLPVYGASYQLMLQIVGLMKHMQRDFRFTLGEKLQRTVLDILVLIYKANKEQAKGEIIAQARERLVETQIYLRLLNDLHQISDKQYVMLAEKTTDISKQLASWERTVLNK